MSLDEFNEKDISDTEAILKYVTALDAKKEEMLLISKGKTVGAILTAQQYSWFLDQLDAHQDTSFVEQRINDRKGAKDLDTLRKELGK